MDFALQGKRALVTGASAGLGFAAARALAAEGCDVDLVARTADTLSAAGDALRGEYQVGVGVHPMDLSDSAGIEGLLDAVGTPDILVNNAGAIPGGDLESIDEPRWREAWDLKVFGYINMTRACFARMRERGSGSTCSP